jgi:hypothetical protein
MALSSLVISLVFSFNAWSIPCLEAFKRFAIENKASRNDEKIALEMLYAKDKLEIQKSESYFMLKNAVDDLAKDNIYTNFNELQAHIFAGFEAGEFCKDAKPHKIAGQIIRIAKKKIKESRIEERDIAKLFNPDSKKEIAQSLEFDSLREPSGREPKKQNK